MGNRISIQFKQGNFKSAILNSHWGGMLFLTNAKKYVRELKKEIKEKPFNKVCEPLDRLEPDTVMVDFVRSITKDEKRITCDLRLVCSTDEIDNSDNGHHIINLTDTIL